MADTPMGEMAEKNPFYVSGYDRYIGGIFNSEVYPPGNQDQERMIRIMRHSRRIRSRMPTPPMAKYGIWDLDSE